MRKNIFFKTFANCILVKGMKRSIICDLQKSNFELIPNDLVEIVETLNNGLSIDEIINNYGIENKDAIEEYLNFLVSKEYGHYLSDEEFSLFPNLDTNFTSPNIISNAVIELSIDNIPNIKKIILELTRFQCRAISIILYESLSIKLINTIIKYTINSSLHSLEITSNYSKSFNSKELKEINIDSSLTCLNFSNSPINKMVKASKNNLFQIRYSTKMISSYLHCGVTNENYFNVTQEGFLEASNYNSCLYKKISIDINGNIKNCPSMPQNFGNIKDTTLEEALSHKDFKKYWNITKDQIDVCKDCEFRYVCTDCRAYIEKPDDIYSKPLKCGYSPYTNKWEEWSTNPLKQKAIDYYGMQELVKKDA